MPGMSDQRFSERLKRIEQRQRGGPVPELLAGVGDVRAARAAAAVRRPAPHLTMLLGGVTGFAAFFHVFQQLGPAGLDALAASPAQVAVLAQGDPVLGVAAVWLAVIGAACVLALALRRGAPRVRAFGVTGAAGGLAAAAALVADPERLAMLLAL